MKKFSLFAAALAALAAFACTKPANEEEQGGGTEPQKEVLNEADILTFKIVKDGGEIEAVVSSYEKRVLIVYLPEQVGILDGAVAEMTLSKGATVSPDPSTPRDYSSDQTFTVTSGDGTLTKTYVVNCEEAKVVNNVSKVWSKTYGTLGIDDQVYDQGQSQIGWCGFDKFVTHEASVFSIEGTKLGSLNVTGIPSEWGLISLANDDDGLFIGTYGTGYDQRNMVDVNSAGAIYIWKDGWDAAPTLLYRFSADNIPEYPQYYYGASDCASLSAAGTYSGDLMVCTLHFGDFAIEGVPTGLHNALHFKNGKLQEFRVFDSRQRLGDGNWIQMVSPVSGTYDGSFVTGDSNQTGFGYSAWVRHDFDDLAGDYALYGAVEDIPGWDPEASYPGVYNYGNYSVGHVRGFTWYGTEAAVVISTFWEGTFMTIQPLDGELAYIRSTEKVSDIHENRSSCAYLFNPADQTGYILINVGFNSGEVILYKLSRTAV